MRMPGTKVKHFIFALLDPLKGRVQPKGSFPFFFFGEREIVETKTIASGGIDIIVFLDRLATKQFTFFMVVVPEMFEYLEKFVD